MIKVLDLLLSVMKEPNSYYGWWCNYYIKTSQPEVKISVMKTLQSLGDCFHFSKSWEVFLNYYYCFNLLFHFIWFCFTRLIDHNDTNRVSVESSESESLKCASEWMVSFMASQNGIAEYIEPDACKMWGVWRRVICSKIVHGRGGERVSRKFRRGVCWPYSRINQTKIIDTLLKA